MSGYVDLNCDLGESFGAYQLGVDEQLLDYVTSANIACGYHAGDYNVMHHTVKLAIEKGVALGAHPGFPDLQGFGRREMQLSPKEVYNLIIYQLGALQAFAELYGQQLQHVKPHGALYNLASQQIDLAEAIARAVYDWNPQVILFGLAGGELIRAGERLGLKVAQEVFADRTYQADGSLTPRTSPKALIHDVDVACTQVMRMLKEGKVKTVEGTEIPIQADTICLHGDAPQAVSFARKLKDSLQEQGILLKRVEF